MGTESMMILLAGVLTLFVLMLLVSLVYGLERLMNDARTRDDVTSGDGREQRFLKASVLHVILRAGR